jgi:hypothetical protein
MSEERYINQPGKPFGAEPTPEHPFVVMIFESARTVEGTRNGLSFETIDDAKSWAFDLSMRWFNFDHWTVVNFLTGEEVAR